MGYATDVKPLSPDLLNLLLRTPDLLTFERAIILETRGGDRGFGFTSHGYCLHPCSGGSYDNNLSCRIPHHGVVFEQTAQTRLPTVMPSVSCGRGLISSCFVYYEGTYHLISCIVQRLKNE